MTETPADASGVRVPPPVIYAGGFAIGYALERFVPLALRPGPPQAVRVIGWGLVAVGALLAASAVVLFRRAGTTPNPLRPTTAIVQHGPYRFTRNPMYLALAVLYLGLTLLVNSVWPLVLFPVVITLIERWVIRREEAYLEAKFGDVYRAYKARVRWWI